MHDQKEWGMKKIELPPLPEWADTTLQGEDRDSLLTWAEAAIEADRKRGGDAALRDHIRNLTTIVRMPNAEYVADKHNDAVKYLRGRFIDHSHHIEGAELHPYSHVGGIKSCQE